MTRTLLLALLACAVALAGCAQQEAPPTDDDAPPVDGDGGETSDPEPLPREHTFVATDFAFDGPDTLPSGWNEITLRNDGAAPHHVYLLRLDEGTYEDWAAALSPTVNTTDEDATEPATTPFGGPNVALPGASVTGWFRLEPGNYVAVCVIPDAEGTPHMAHGMHRPVTVVEADDAGVEPEADVTVTLDDFNFTLDGNLSAGRNVVKVVNAGEFIHEAAVFGLVGNATAEEAIAGFAPGATAPPPVDEGAGITGIAPGAVAYFAIDAETGRYAFVCFEHDGTEGAPHFVHGMVREVEVA